MRKPRPREGQKLSPQLPQGGFRHLKVGLGVRNQKLFPQGQTKLRLQCEGFRSERRRDFQWPRLQSSEAVAQGSSSVSWHAHTAFRTDRQAVRGVSDRVRVWLAHGTRHGCLQGGTGGHCPPLATFSPPVPCEPPLSQTAIQVHLAVFALGGNPAGGPGPTPLFPRPGWVAS